MRVFGEWLSAILKNWILLLSGGVVIVALGAIEHFNQRSISWAAYVCVVSALVVIASFQAWKEKRLALLAHERLHDDDPHIVIEFDGPPLPPFAYRHIDSVGERPIVLRNIGARTAYAVQIQPLELGRCSATFPSVEVLQPSAPARIKPQSFKFKDERNVTDLSYLDVAMQFEDIMSGFDRGAGGESAWRIRILCRDHLEGAYETQATIAYSLEHGATVSGFQFRKL